MTVIFKKGEGTFKAHEFLWAKKEVIDAVVEQALINQTEAFLDMIIDNEKPEDITRDSINNILRGVKDSTGEFLNDVMSDIRSAIEKRLEEVGYGAAVTGIKYDLAGDVVDIEVDISVS